MKSVLFAFFLTAAGVSAPAFAQAAEFCSASAQVRGGCEQSASFDLASLFAKRPSATDCYLECKPMSGGGDGDSYTKCFNACMRRR